MGLRGALAPRAAAGAFQKQGAHPPWAPASWAEGSGSEGALGSCESCWCPDPVLPWPRSSKSWGSENPGAGPEVAETPRDSSP